MTPVRIEAGASRWWRIGVALIAAMSVGSVLVWWWLMPSESAVLAAATGSVALLVAFALVVSLRRVGASGLVFDGRAWRLIQPGRDETTPGTVRAMVDLGGFLLLRFDAAASARHAWVPVDSTDPTLPWHTLRAAVYAAPRAIAPRP